MIERLCSLFKSEPQPGHDAYESYFTLKYPLPTQNTQQTARQQPSPNLPINQIRRHSKPPFPASIKRATSSQTQQYSPLDSGSATDQVLHRLYQHPEASIRKVKKSSYSPLIQQYSELMCKWTDSEFLPNQKAFGEAHRRGRVYWKRVTEVVSNPQFLESQMCSPSDLVSSQMLERCPINLVSVLAAIMETPSIIKLIFGASAINTYGIYMMRLTLSGVHQQVVVDDYVPCDESNRLLYLQPTKKAEVWPIILFKGLAKLYGSYSEAITESPYELLRTITRAPTSYSLLGQDKDSNESSWASLLAGYRQGSLMCLNVRDSGDSSAAKMGLFPGYSYTIIAAFDKPLRLLKFRNPFASLQWSGEASRTDQSFWSRLGMQARQEINYLPDDSSVFYMIWDDVVAYFDTLYICEVHNHANYLYEQAIFSRKRGLYFQLDIIDEGYTNITLSQPSIKLVPKEQQDMGLARLTLVVSRQEQAHKGHEYKYVGSASTRSSIDNNLRIQSLPKGRYIIYAKCDWTRQQPDMGCVSVYSTARSYLQKTTLPKSERFLYKTFLDHARNNPTKQMLREFPMEWICSDFLLSEGGYGYIAIHLDDHSNRRLGLQIIEKEYNEKRLILKKPYRGQGRIKLIVEPGKQLIVLFRLKALNFPSQLALPTPKIYNLV